jgi:hypothetical protein
VIEFMLLGAPRSATAWCSNWLTTDNTLCIHEPLARWSIGELDEIKSSKVLGIACTVLAQAPEFVNRHSSRKVILHRDATEVRESMRKLRIEGAYDFAAMDRIEGMHCDWRKVFTDPEPIYTFLLNRKFDRERHAELINLNVQNAILIRKLQEREVAFADG